MCLLPPLNIEAGCAPTSPARRSARSATPPRAPNFFTMADGTCEARRLRLDPAGLSRLGDDGAASGLRGRGCGRGVVTHCTVVSASVRITYVGRHCC